MTSHRIFVVGGVLLSILLIGVQSGCDNKAAPPPKKQEAMAPKPPPPLAFTIDARPDSPISLGDVRQEQKADPVEVLKGWKVIYQAPIDDPTIKWFRDNTYIDTGRTIGTNENIVGSYLITYELNGVKSQPRRLTVGEVQSDPADAFKLAAAGRYIKAQNQVFPNFPWAAYQPLMPGDQAITMSGRVSLKAGSPGLTKFNWGFVQGVEMTQINQAVPVGWVFDPASRARGAFIPQFYYWADVPANTNDAPPGSQLHGLSTGRSLGTSYSYPDTPGRPDGEKPLDLLDFDGKKVTVLYAIPTDKVEIKFKVWQVVFHSDTKQYFPLMEQAWTIDIDTTQAGPWTPQVVGAPATAVTRPSSDRKPDGTSNSTGQYLASRKSKGPDNPDKRIP